MPEKKNNKNKWIELAVILIGLTRSKLDFD